MISSKVEPAIDNREVGVHEFPGARALKLRKKFAGMQNEIEDRRNYFTY